MKRRRKDKRVIPTSQLREKWISSRVASVRLAETADPKEYLEELKTNSTVWRANFSKYLGSGDYQFAAKMARLDLAEYRKEHPFKWLTVRSRDGRTEGKETQKSVADPAVSRLVLVERFATRPDRPIYKSRFSSVTFPKQIYAGHNGSGDGNHSEGGNADGREGGETIVSELGVPNERTVYGQTVD